MYRLHCITFKSRREGKRETKHKNTLGTHTEKLEKHSQICQYCNTKLINKVKETNFTNIYAFK